MCWNGKNLSCCVYQIMGDGWICLYKVVEFSPKWTLVADTVIVEVCTDDDLAFIEYFANIFATKRRNLWTNWIEIIVNIKLVLRFFTKWFRFRLFSLFVDKNHFFFRNLYLVPLFYCSNFTRENFWYFG